MGTGRAEESEREDERQGERSRARASKRASIASPTTPPRQPFKRTRSGPGDGEQRPRAPRGFAARREFRAEADGGGVRLLGAVDAANDAGGEEIHDGNAARR